MIEGDAAKEDFGLTPETKTMLTNTNIIFHVAATVRFNEKIRLAVHTNVRVTKNLLVWAKQLSNIKAFVYVSTAFSNCTNDTVKEEHSKSLIEVDKLLTVVECLDDDKLEAINPVLRDTCPNNYILTKLSAENAVLKYGDTFPTCIVRPSIVIATSDEPIKGWINNVYGATGILVAAAIGLLHTVHACKEDKAEMIPADYVISNIIAAAWDVGTRKSLTKSEQELDLSPEEKVPIYNIVSTCQNPITWNRFMKLNENFGYEVPTIKMYWYYMFIFNRYLLLHELSIFFFHIVPAFIVDTLARLIGRPPVLLDTYKKIHKAMDALQFFLGRQWIFENENVVKLWKKLNSVDQKTFNFNMENLDWEIYFYHYIRGVRFYILKDTFDTIKEARIKLTRLFIAHYSIIIVVSLLLLWTTVSFVNFLWSYCPLSH
ncbi:fatty acyl-CoA reductase wat isoform X2 [Nomia melanderi]